MGGYGNKQETEKRENGKTGGMRGGRRGEHGENGKMWEKNQRKRGDGEEGEMKMGEDEKIGGMGEMENGKGEVGDMWLPVPELAWESLHCAEWNGNQAALLSPCAVMLSQCKRRNAYTERAGADTDIGAGGAHPHPRHAHTHAHLHAHGGNSCGGSNSGSNSGGNSGSNSVQGEGDQRADPYSPTQLQHLFPGSVRLSSAQLQQQGLCPSPKDLPWSLPMFLTYADKLGACCAAVRVAWPLLRAGSYSSTPTPIPAPSTSTPTSTPTPAPFASKVPSMGRVRPLLLLHRDVVARLRQQRAGGDAVVVCVPKQGGEREGGEGGERERGEGGEGGDSQAVVLMSAALRSGEAVAAPAPTSAPALQMMRAREDMLRAVAAVQGAVSDRLAQLQRCLLNKNDNSRTGLLQALATHMLSDCVVSFAPHWSGTDAETGVGAGTGAETGAGADAA
ncbi:hypothetical protein B484DRAFT_415650, partial [Ochromonadaceae sp. CCMP2298]